MQTKGCSDDILILGQAIFDLLEKEWCLIQALISLDLLSKK